jgi:DNA-binding response OmpR family regulator
MAVDVAHDGLSAAAKLDLHPYDVAVLDRDLPGPHGDVLRQMITEDRPMVLMLTAAGSPGDRVSGLTLATSPVADGRGIGPPTSSTHFYRR